MFCADFKWKPPKIAIFKSGNEARARERKKAKHFLGHGPEAPRFTRAVRARARARARAKYRRNFNVINDCFTQWNCKFLKSSCFGAAKKATPIVDMSDAQFQSELKEWTSFILSCWKQASPMSTMGVAFLGAPKAIKTWWFKRVDFT